MPDDGSKDLNIFSRPPLINEPLSIGGVVDGEHLKWAFNPLVAAAEPLLNWATILKEKRHIIGSADLYETLCREIKKFENRAYALNYRSQVILAARYLLCALLDEMAITYLSTKQNQWQKKTLIQTFQPQSSNQDHFFQILQLSSDDPPLFLDVLELGYLGISLGYRGQYRGMENTEELHRFSENLYHLIKAQHEEFSRRLFIESQGRKARGFRWRRSYNVLLLILAVIILFVVYGVMTIDLNGLIGKGSG